MEGKRKSPYVVTSERRDTAVERSLRELRGFFITGRLDQKRMELGNKEFEKQKAKLTEEFARQWEQIQQAKAVIRELEERSGREIMEWLPLEKVYRVKLEAEGYPKEVVEKTIMARRAGFERCQRQVKARLKPRIDPDEDFRRRVLNPATRKQAFQAFLLHHIHKSRFLLEALELLWEEVDSLKAKKRK